MLKITYFLSVFLCFFTFNTPLFSQNADTVLHKKTVVKNPLKTKALKIFLDFKTFDYTSNFTSNGSVIVLSSSFSRKDMGFYPSIGYSKILKNESLMEFSISPMGFRYKEQMNTRTFNNINSTVFPVGNSEKVFEMRIGSRFEYAFPIFKKPKSNSHFYLGASSEPFISVFKVVPFTTSSYPHKSVEFKNIVGVVPRYIHNINKNCFLDINIPIPLFGFSMRYGYNEDPVLPTSARNENEIKATFLPYNYQIRFGLGIKI
jgi:hypothetical protein